jgi:hypothetical protein
MLRQSPLFQFKHGDHTCVFYRSEDSLREVLTPFIADGLRRGERCFLAQKPHIGKRLLFDLDFLGLDTADAIRRGALEIHTEDEVYFPNRKFEPRAMMDLLMRSMNDAAERGFTGLRTAGEGSWAAEGRNECDQLVEYEEMVDDYFPDKPAVALCQYNMSAFSPRVLDAVIEAHRRHVSDLSPASAHSGVSIRSGNYWSEIIADKKVVSPNYYYVVRRRRPAEVLGWGIAHTYDTAHEKAEQIVQAADI